MKELEELQNENARLRAAFMLLRRDLLQISDWYELVPIVQNPTCEALTGQIKTVRDFAKRCVVSGENLLRLSV